MKYRIIVTETANDDLADLPVNLAESIDRKINALAGELPGSVKRLRGIEYGYRLPFAAYRILFDLEGDTITIQRILHRRHAYASIGKGQKRKKGQH
jgi:mRNA-degrading endonuclease RelE of RelBE toxin-antitoxin system